LYIPGREKIDSKNNTSYNKRIFITLVDSLKFEGVENFRWIVLFATLTKTDIKITKCKFEPHHINLMRLLEIITKGSKIVFKKNGALKYHPGSIIGGKYITHDCALSRGIGYYLEILYFILLFSREPSTITLKGITNHPSDISIDMIKNYTLPLLARFIDEDHFRGVLPKAMVVSRGMVPDGGGEVIVQCGCVKQSLKPQQMIQEGLWKRIRGVSVATRMNTYVASRIVEAAKGVLLKLIPDIWITADVPRGKGSGASPGCSVYLQVESHLEKSAMHRLGTTITVENFAEHQLTPEQIGEHIAHQLLDEIKQGGCIDRHHQVFTLVAMALTSEDVNMVRFGKRLTKKTALVLRLIRDFFHVQYHIKEDLDDEDNRKGFILTGKGSGHRNLARRGG